MLNDNNKINKKKHIMKFQYIFKISLFYTSVNDRLSGIKKKSLKIIITVKKSNNKGIVSSGENTLNKYFSCINLFNVY